MLRRTRRNSRRFYVTAGGRRGSKFGGHRWSPSLLVHAIPELAYTIEFMVGQESYKGIGKDPCCPAEKKKENTIPSFRMPACLPTTRSLGSYVQPLGDSDRPTSRRLPAKFTAESLIQVLDEITPGVPPVRAACRPVTNSAVRGLWGFCVGSVRHRGLSMVWHLELRAPCGKTYASPNVRNGFAVPPCSAVGTRVHWLFRIWFPRVSPQSGLEGPRQEQSDGAIAGWCVWGGTESRPLQLCLRAPRQAQAPKLGARLRELQRAFCSTAAWTPTQLQRRRYPTSSQTSQDLGLVG